MVRLSRLALIAVISVAAVALPDVSHGADSTYVVQNGDTLFGIAARLDVRLPELLSVNGLSATSVIQPGQQLTVPGTTVSAPATSGGSTYTVREGDWLSRIADRHGITLAALLAANNLTATSLIQPGQQLTIPGGTASPTPSPTPAGGPTYTVQAGDALSAIAARHRVTLDSLLDLNDLTANSVIHPGQQLTLPKGAAAPTPTTGTGVDRVVSYALAQLGKPYRFFTAGPNTFDCSGLTVAAYAQIGVTLIHHSTSQAGQGTAVDFWSEPIRAGDLIFLATRGSTTINHVGMAVNATTWIQARRPGDVVRLAPLPPKGIIMAVRRFVPAS